MNKRLSNGDFSVEEIDEMNNWHESVYGYKLEGMMLEKLLRAKDLGTREK